MRIDYSHRNKVNNNNPLVRQENYKSAHIACKDQKVGTMYDTNIHHKRSLIKW